ncbi:hypothetical protein D0C36_18725 [Mucilaginibacter conchicola]|uniref:Uncharacterized protein n=1 Tax=Mucilaginibacter conchicola TaxID=2303333 RepID=A0A372NPX7_9SPHI|nr:hypothetical protein [Mucilaginibacter conchicola]RFZ90981.1 hypothetical protein D0C36_18725 [Mucilaginibacter conchicola]
MLFTADLLQRLEQNSDFKKPYLTAGSMGQNKLVMLPVILAVIGLFGTYEFNDLSKSDPGYKTYMYACLALAVICIIAIVIIQRGAKKNVAANIDEVPVCLGKKIYGNDRAQVYYGIYTPGAKRHDIEFIEYVAFRILNIAQEEDVALRNQVNKMFDVRFADAASPAVRLPDGITDGEEVYQRQYSFSTVSTEMKNSINENQDRFIVLAFTKTNGVLVRDVN